MNTLPMIAVIIPFYQRESGILRRALTSVLGQQGEFVCEVLVVDDGSPTSPETEIEGLTDSNPNISIRLLKQMNAGPGAARNAGLNAVAKETDFVAFLDSDDEWSEGHLQNSIRALEYGYDFYFSDLYFSDYKEKSAFARAGKIVPKEHHLLDQDCAIYEYNDDMVDQILVKGNVIGTSNVVYRFSKYSDLRFREAFYNGQDYLFWLDFCFRSKRFVFSTQVECDCGTGLNIYAGAGWGTERSLARARNELQLWTFVGRYYGLTSTQHDGVNQKINIVREAIVRDILHRMTHFQPISMRLLVDIFKADPSLSLRSLPCALRIVFAKFSRS